MPRKAGETVTQWYERAIVMQSIAASDLEDLEMDPTPVSQVHRRAVTKAAKLAAADLDAALDALLTERAASKSTPGA